MFQLWRRGKKASEFSAFIFCRMNRPRKYARRIGYCLGSMCGSWRPLPWFFCGMRFHTSLLHILHPKPRNMRSQPTSRILQRYAAWKSSMVPQVVSASSIVNSSGHSLGENRTCSFLPKAKSAVHDTRERYGEKRVWTRKRFSARLQDLLISWVGNFAHVGSRH